VATLTSERCIWTGNSRNELSSRIMIPNNLSNSSLVRHLGSSERMRRTSLSTRIYKRHMHSQSKLSGQELISYRYLSYCSCCWGAVFQKAGVGFWIWRHTFKMAVMTSFHAEKSCHLVSGHAASAGAYTVVFASSWSIVHSTWTGNDGFLGSLKKSPQ